MTSFAKASCAGGTGGGGGVAGAAGAAGCWAGRVRLVVRAPGAFESNEHADEANSCEGAVEKPMGHEILQVWPPPTEIRSVERAENRQVVAPGNDRASSEPDEQAVLDDAGGIAQSA